MQKHIPLSLFVSAKYNLTQQYLISVLAVIVVSFACFFFKDLVDYKTVALILLLVVSVLAMLYNLWPVLLAATISALTWNFFFIPPHFTFHIEKAEDILMFFMYFVIASLNGVLTYKIRQIRRLAQRKEEKEKTLKLYNTLLNSLSHELRTPIATIIGATDNLQHNYSKLNESNKSELIQEISKASLRLNKQVDNLLNMSRLESGTIKLKLDWCDINELIYEVIKQVKENTKSHTFIVEIEDQLPLFKIDYGILEQVLFNLLQNAVTYTPAGSTIRLKAKTINKNLMLIVEDNGQGFPSTEIKNVFDKFYRLKNTTASGTGLGLSIVKGFVEAHQGTVGLQNAKPNGAIFTIVIHCEASYINNLNHE